MASSSKERRTEEKKGRGERARRVNNQHERGDERRGDQFLRGPMLAWELLWRVFAQKRRETGRQSSQNDG